MKKKLAFSLVELAVVLIILGLLVVGISTGERLIGQSKLRTVIDDMEQYKVAFNTFYADYQEYPGDMLDSSALTLFGVTNQTRQAANPAGDKYIGGYREAPMAFWHMQLAEIISGSYTGVFAHTEIPGVNVGKARYSDQSGFNFFTFGRTNNQWAYGNRDVYGLSGVIVIVFGNIDTSGYQVADAALTAADAFQIDVKLDDGLPNKGDVMADHGRDVGSDNKCINYNKDASYYAASDDPLEYKLSNEDLACRMMFTLQ